jgi:uncharacterized protein YndB with AHSA1/START domain
MSEPLFIINTIDINATPRVVWDVLTNPEQTKKYMFGCETVSEWQAGSDLLWKGNYEGKEMVFVKGTIMKIVPEKFLAYTTIDPNSNIDDKADNYLTVTYDLSFANNQTTLKVTQGDYSLVAEGERRYRESSNGGEGWNSILIQIKKIAEGA